MLLGSVTAQEDFLDALRAQEVKPGEMTMAHLAAWQRALEEAGIVTEAVSPILLPDYTRHVR